MARRRKPKQLDLFDMRKMGLEHDHFERWLRNQGFAHVAGIDEAGRGPLAGPVLAAAVILPAGSRIKGLTDSKRLSDAKRRELYVKIRDKAIAIGVGRAEPAEIDRMNILQATMQSMRRAVDALQQQPDYLLVDGITPIPTVLPQRTLVKGELRSISVAAASIIAKVERDDIMLEMDKLYPDYGFARHKGYGTEAHLLALRQHGVCPIHRKTYRQISDLRQRL
ncbi:MAG: ribonuclease HII [Candidatus Alcyoniella australis]|nr:ribonuclease HII [Candidatus Alcyoniella australis]